MPLPDSLLPLFHALPDAYLLLSPDLRIEAASDAYLAAVLMERGRLVGQPLFDVYRATADAPDAGFVRDLQASLAQAAATGQPHQMERQRYDVPDPNRPGHFVERHWAPRTIPILDEEGRLLHLLHVAQDATPQIRHEAQLRSSQTREQSARDTAEVQDQLLHNVLHQAPVAIAYLEGPGYLITLANATVCEIWARTQQQVMGLPLLEALPELQGQGIDELLDGVRRTGTPYVGTELPVQLLRHGHIETIYFNFVYQPQRSGQGEITGVLVVANDVTEQVIARQQMEQQERHTAHLNEELASINEELTAANEEVLANNNELVRAQLELQHLNQILEARVAERTAALLRAQQKAEHQQQRLERLFQQAPAAICMLNGPELVYELVNPAYQQLFPGRSLLGKPLLEALPELAGQRVWQTLRKVYQTGVSHAEMAIRIPVAKYEGAPLEDFYFNYIQQARFDEHGAIDGVVVFAFDVTAQVQAQHASAATARRLQVLTDSLPVLIGYLDQDRRYQFANEAYRAWFRQDPAKLLGQPVREIVGEKAYAVTKGYMDRALAGEHLSFEAQMPYRQDLTKHIHTSYVPDVREGQVVGFYTLVTDITEQVQAREQVQALNEELAAINEELTASNEELSETNQQLTRTNQDLDNFVYAASHDLKQPVNNLAGLFAEVRRGVTFHDPAEEQLLVPLIDGALHQLSATIDDLAALGQTQQVSAPTERVALSRVVEEVLQTLKPQIKATQARITTDFERLPTLKYARTNLRTILLNLLGNSLKYADPTRPARIQVTAWLEASQPVLMVQDNGLGFDADKHGPELFQLFRRFHTHTPGTGVGLYLVHRIVQAQGGHVAVESRVGEGATFRVALGPA
ncbi:PAS domain-containing protein [Hymenobacter sp. 5516J-16]|uniref:PAS domain-containing protein n=1 Tax=Hymenobacter sp. 5516J-16 TaxID=2932253 RepID=UPI001FD15A33|nr:PAS domain-containing protein [Hymenobacter sp. 5516J-16]UOQ75991.1 PAS domain-containing protein [Hymenobacter sp. 5516J-16]